MPATLSRYQYFTARDGLRIAYRSGGSRRWRAGSAGSRHGQPRQHLATRRVRSDEARTAGHRARHARPWAQRSRSPVSARNVRRRHDRLAGPIESARRCPSGGQGSNGSIVPSFCSGPSAAMCRYRARPCPRNDFHARSCTSSMADTGCTPSNARLSLHQRCPFLVRRAQAE